MILVISYNNSLYFVKCIPILNSTSDVTIVCFKIVTLNNGYFFNISNESESKLY